MDQELQSRMAHFGAVMCGLEVPSVIKFYAREWKILSKSTSIFPQKEYIEKILSDSYHLQNTLLKQIANQYGQEIHKRNWGGFSVVEMLKILLWRPFRRWVILPAKQHIPIIKKIAIWKMRRLRRQKDKETGKYQNVL